MTTSSLLPLYFDVANARARNAVRTFRPARRALPTSIRAAVTRRDFDTCRFCGFRVRKYQEVIATASTDRDIDSIVTACIFCHQCFHLDQVGMMRSGVLIWLPELSQAKLHELMRQVYVRRISQGAPASQARQILDELLKRKEPAKDRLGTEEPRVLGARMAHSADEGELADLRDRMRDIRLLPFDRRVVKEGDLEYNQFPQILAFWRSRDGPFHLRLDADFSLLDEFAESWLGLDSKNL